MNLQLIALFTEEAWWYDDNSLNLHKFNSSRRLFLCILFKLWLERTAVSWSVDILRSELLLRLPQGMSRLWSARSVLYMLISSKDTHPHITNSRSYKHDKPNPDCDIESVEQSAWKILGSMVRFYFVDLSLPDTAIPSSLCMRLEVVGYSF